MLSRMLWPKLKFGLFHLCKWVFYNHWYLVYQKKKLSWI